MEFQPGPEIKKKSILDQVKKIKLIETTDVKNHAHYTKT